MKKNANGEGGLSYHGYQRITCPDGRRLFEHVIVAERVFGRRLPKGACVHHVNEIRTDNRTENLVICQSHGYHALLHARLNALRTTGDVNNRSCRFCHKYDVLANLKRNNTSYYHLTCAARYARAFRAKRGSNP